MSSKTKRSLTIFAIITVAYFLGLSWIDPDFGWHYRLGQIITTSGISKTDPFSFTMPSYPFVDYEWLSNLLYYKIPYTGLALVHAVLTVASPLIVLSVARKNKYWLLPAVLAWSSMFLRFGVRPQVFNWFFLAVLIRVLYDTTNWVKFRWALPFLMLFWANFHGSYPLGLGLITIFFVLKSSDKKRIAIADVVVLAISVGATLINPYGIRNWQEVFEQMKLSGLYRQTVGEWRPAFFTFDLGFLAIHAFTVVLMWANKKKVRLWEVVAVGGGFIAASTTGRYAPLASLVVAPVLATHLEHTARRANLVSYGVKRFRVFYVILLVIALSILVLTLTDSFLNKNSLSETRFYPIKATQYLESQQPNRKVFADYGLGGYLVWKAPSHKYFVDGRMAGWVRNSAPANESKNIFIEYMDTMCGHIPLADTLDKYDVDFAIASKTLDTSVLKSPLELQLAKFATKVGFSYCETQISVAKEIEKLDWKIVYEDDQAIVYER